MKILITSSVMPIRGGVTAYMDTLAKKLEELGHYVITTGITGNTKKGSRFLSPKEYRLIKALTDNDFIFFIAFHLAKLMLFLKNSTSTVYGRLDVVHAQDVNAVNALYYLCRIKKTKLVLTLHGHLSDGGTATRKIDGSTSLGRHLLKEEMKAFKRAGHIIVVSDYAYNLVKKYTDIRRISLIRNFVDTGIYRPIENSSRNKMRKEMGYTDTDFVIIFAGRLVKSKGVSYILEGIREVVGKLPVKLLVAGDGPEMDRLLQFVKENRLGAHIHFKGEISKEDLLRLYNISDAFIMASITGAGNVEGTPMSLLEAMSCGLPVITTVSGGIAGVVTDMENALVIKERDKNDIERAVTRLYEDSELYHRLSGNALKHIKESYSLDSVINKIISIYFPEGGAS